jgi:hypothetical protein
VPYEKTVTYERYREYFTGRTADINPGSDMFILIREGLAAWLLHGGPEHSSEAHMGGTTDRETDSGELACLLASIVMGGTPQWITMEKFRQNICQGPDMCTSGNPQLIR